MMDTNARVARDRSGVRSPANEVDSIPGLPARRGAVRASPWCPKTMTAARCCVTLDYTVRMIARPRESSHRSTRIHVSLVPETDVMSVLEGQAADLARSRARFSEREQFSTLPGNGASAKSSVTSRMPRGCFGTSRISRGDETLPGFDDQYVARPALPAAGRGARRRVCLLRESNPWSCGGSTTTRGGGRNRERQPVSVLALAVMAATSDITCI